MTKLNKGSSDGGRSSFGERENGYTAPGNRTYQAWRFENPSNGKTKEFKGTMMTWCDNDRHM